MTQSDPFYADAKRYWEKVPATENGMLGGFAFISDEDVSGSKTFMLATRDAVQDLRLGRALDCGAGIGRVTKSLLLPLFETVDMVELNQGFLDRATEYIGAESSRVGQRFCSGLQSFVPRRGHYDVIWCQWVLGHLTDAHLVCFLQRCVDGLSAGGVLFIKENISQTEEPEFDDEDSSYTRPRDHLVRVFTQAGLEVLREEVQENFPSGIFEVRMFALRGKQQ